MRKKSIALLMAVTLCIGSIIGGTVAWLTAESSEVKNTFSTSDIGVELNETTQGYQMIPGWDISKDPKAKITTGSEDAYLFVEVVESDNFDDFMTYAIADGWTLYNGTAVGSDIDTSTNDSYVIYRKVTSGGTSGIGTEFPILKDNKVTVKGNVTKDMMSTVGFEQPTLTFTAYAHQLYRSKDVEFGVAAAWNNLNSQSVTE